MTITSGLSARARRSFFPVAGFSLNGDVVFVLEHAPETAAHERMVVYQQYRNFF